MHRNLQYHSTEMTTEMIDGSRGLRGTYVIALSLFAVLVHGQNCNAGNDAFLALCNSGAPVQLLSLTNGDPGGQWLDPNSIPHPGVFTPGVSVAGCYLYVIPANGNCLGDTATVCVTVNLAPDAGMNSTLSICSSQLPITLFNQLGGAPDPGGWWTAPNGNASNGVFGLASPSGCYTYTVTGIPPCANATSTLCITVTPAPDAGMNASINWCSSNGSFLMIEELNGSPQPGGTWTGPGGAAHPPYFDPMTDAPGIYTYTIPGSAPCVSASAILTVTFYPPPCGVQNPPNGTSTN